MKTTYKRISDTEIKRFRSEDGIEILYVIETSFQDDYIVLEEDIYKMTIKQVFVGNKNQVEEKFKIQL